MIEIQEAVHIQCIQLSEFGYKNTHVKPSSQCINTSITSESLLPECLLGGEKHKRKGLYPSASQNNAK